MLPCGLSHLLDRRQVKSIRQRIPTLDKGFTLVELLVVILILAILMAVAIPAFVEARERAQEQKERLSQLEQPAPAPVVDTTPTDLTGLWITLGVLGGLALLSVIVMVFVRLTSRGRAARAETKRQAEARTALETELREKRADRMRTQRGRHQELQVAYGTYLTDPLAVLRRPLLNDVTVESTARFVEAYADLTSMGMDTDDGTVPDEDSVERYRRAVQEAWRTWRSAEAEATRVGTKNFSREDQKKIKRAIDLLKLASDRGASEFERASALTQANKLIEGLVTLPKESVLALEAAVRPAIEA